jgi:Peptidase family M23
MAIERNPVPGSTIPEPLRCKDFDPVTGKRKGFECESEQKDHASGKFDCTNKGRAIGKCDRRTFLYPRSRKKRGFHTHQGIDFFPDLEQLRSGLPIPILSVTAGKVCRVLEWDGESSGYGNVIAVFDGERTFWYAHCAETLLREGEPVFERQQIAIVGNTGRAGGLHLHFEVHQGRSKGPPAVERTIFDPAGPRLDPLEVLESLGPWGMRQTFSARGTLINAEEVRDLHAEIESSREGGCFPLGANNLWHGGVHLRMPPGGELHAPFDGHIVALRLDPDPATAITPHGSTNFILIRHELSPAVFERLQLAPGAPPPAGPDTPPAVGRKSSNLPADVRAVKQALHDRTNAAGHRFYAPADTSDVVDAELLAAIEAFQRTLDNPYRKTPERWPDGRITVGGHTWKALFPAGRPGSNAPVDPAVTIDPARTVYTLFMHVGAVPIDAALAKRVKWLAALDATRRTHLETRGPDGMTPVLSGLAIPIAGNDVVWLAGQAPVAKPDGSAPLVSLVHWEVFSATQLVAAWELAALRDPTDDLTLDVPEQLFDAVELTALPGFSRDDFITALEMREFYATERAAFLRRTPCLFRSEWGLDLPAAIISMAVMGIDTTGLAESTTPLNSWASSRLTSTRSRPRRSTPPPTARSSCGCASTTACPGPRPACSSPGMARGSTPSGATTTVRRGFAASCRASTRSRSMARRSRCTRPWSRRARPTSSTCSPPCPGHRPHAERSRSPCAATPTRSRALASRSG